MQTDPPALRLQLQLHNESQIIDTLFANFVKSMMPQDNIFKTPGQASLQTQQLWRHLEVPAVPSQANQDYLPQTSKKADFGSKLEAKI